MKAIIYGFDYSPESIASVVAACKGAGITELVWALHENKLLKYQSEFDAHGVRCFNASSPTSELVHATKMRIPVFDGPVESDLDYMLEREGRYDSVWESRLMKERLRVYLYRFMQVESPDVVLFSDVPHAACSYMLLRLSERQGVPTLTIRYGPTPYHASIVESVDDSLLGQVRRFSEPGPLSDVSRAYIESLQGSYEAAAPVYVKAASSRAQVAIRRIRSGRLPALKLVRTTIERARLARYYESVAMSHSALEKLDLPVVSVLLHLQPERTTVPEGGVYAQQWKMIQELSALVPEGWRVLVKEHPATFIRGARLVRTKDFYQQVLSLGNTALLSTAISTFEIAEYSKVLATVTGTAAFETAARGGRCILFGNSVHRGCLGIVDAEHLSVEAIVNADHSLWHAGLPVSEFLSAFDNSAVSWTQSTGAPDVREVRASGGAAMHLIPSGLERYL